MKTKFKIICMMLTLCICVVTVFNFTLVKNGAVEVHETLVEPEDFDYAKAWDELADKEIEFAEETITIRAAQIVDEQTRLEYETIRNLNDEGIELKMKLLSDGQVLEEVFLEGKTITNEQGEVDILVEENGQQFLLSEIAEDSIDENLCYAQKLDESVGFDVLGKCNVGGVGGTILALALAGLATLATVGVIGYTGRRTSTNTKVLFKTFRKAISVATIAEGI